MTLVPGTIGKFFSLEMHGKYWKIWAPLFFSATIAVILDYLRSDGIHPHFDLFFILETIFLLLWLLFLGIYLRERAREAVQPSEDSYNSLLKYCLAILLFDIGIIAVCFFLAGIFVNQAGFFIIAMLAGIIASLWYFGTKARSLGFVFQ